MIQPMNVNINTLYICAFMGLVYIVIIAIAALIWHLFFEVFR